MSRGEKGLNNKQRIDSWKEIASFFGRDERTVKRWEQSRSLPIHRVPGSGKSGVFAYASELREWLHSSSQQATTENAAGEPSASSQSVEPSPASAESLSTRQTDAESRPASLEAETSDAAPVAGPSAILADSIPHAGSTETPDSATIPASFSPALPPSSGAPPVQTSAGSVSRQSHGSNSSRSDRSGPGTLVTRGPGARGAVLEMPRTSAYTAPANTGERAGEESRPLQQDPRIRKGSVEDRRFPPYRRFFWSAGIAAVIAAGFLLLGQMGYLRTSLAPQPQVGTVKGASHGTRDIQAEDFYLKGRYYWSRRTADSLRQAVDAFTQAIVRDPADAEAYAGLADTYDLMPEFAGMPRSEAYPRAIAASSKAVALDDSLSEAHRALAFGLFYGNWEIPRALAEYRRAIQLNPDDVEAHHWYATSLMALGQNKQALAELERARQMEPGSKSILADRALLIYAMGDHARATADLLEMERAEPEFLSPPVYLCRMYLESGNYPAYIEQLQKIAGISKAPDQVSFAAALQRAFALGGRREMLEEMQRLQRAAFDRGQVSGYDLAYTGLLLGSSKNVVPYLRNAVSLRDERVLALPGSAFEPSLKGDPAYQQLRAEILEKTQPGGPQTRSAVASATNP